MNVLLAYARTSLLLIVSFLSANSFGMDPNSLIMLSRLQNLQTEIARQTANLQRMNIGAPAAPFSTTTQPPKSQGEHTGFVSLPRELQGRAMVHIKCDCNDLANDGHFCGSHALSHAVDEDQLFGVRSEHQKPSEVVKAAFSRLGISKIKAEMTSAKNIKSVADELGLNAFYFTLIDGYVASNFYSSHDMPVVLAARQVEKWRKEFLFAGEKPLVRHAFFSFDKHVALFSIIWDGKLLSIKIHDNLNEKISVPSQLYTMADFLAKNFVEFDREDAILNELVKVLVKDNPARYSQKFNDIKMRPESSENRNALLGYLFEQWALNTKEATLLLGDLDVRLLNAPLAILKKLHAEVPTSNAPALVIMTYDTMLDILNERNDPSDAKKNALAKIIAAIKRSAKEQKVFSISDDAQGQRLFERANTMLTVLNQY